MDFSIVFKRVFFSFILFLHWTAQGQEDTLRQKLAPVDIVAEKESSPVQTTAPVQVISAKELSGMPVLQMSDVLKHFAGMVVRDYGGVGGLKTISVRGLGSQHTAFAFDGIPVADCQSGQVDFSKFPIDNVQTLSVTTGSPDDIFLPARLLAAGNLVSMHTTRPTFSDHKNTNLKIGFSGGSFCLLNPSLLLENRILKNKKAGSTLLSSSLNVNYLYSKGNYPFILHYGGARDSTSNERRTNSDISAFSAVENLFFHFNSHSEMTVKLYYYHSERGLPGAVLFYNTSSRQRLWDDNAFAQIHYHNHFSKKIGYQANIKYNFANQRYLDPDYLNEEGKLDNHYQQHEIYLSNTVSYSPHHIISLALSNDLFYNLMYANLADFCYPRRFSSITALSAFLDLKHLDIKCTLLHTGIVNKTKTGEAGKNLQKLSPALGISIKPILFEEFYIRLSYQHVYRVPTFNDLYYRIVGNIKLNPEQAHQFNVGLAYEKNHLNKIHYRISVDGYYNIVKDKIVAIPNKNLFIWTMLNFGRVEMAGTDACIDFSYQIIKQLNIFISGNYSYCYAVDATQADSKTYHHQIPYTPLHSGTLTGGVRTPWIDIAYTLLLSGRRYALQQNIPANLLAAYSDHSIAIGKDFKIKQFWLGAKLECLNLGNQQYEIIKNYPLQGRSFRFHISFKW